VINSRSLDLDPTGENGSGGGSPWALVFRRIFRWGRTVVELRQCSGGVWAMEKVRRSSARSDGLGNVNSALDCFQWTERESVGGDTDAGDLRESPEWSVFCARR
jgi:hypothetical protein